jgi:hypothetical protein
MTAVQAERMTPEKGRAFGSRCEHALVEVLAAYTDWLDKVDEKPPALGATHARFFQRDGSA